MITSDDIVSRGFTKVFRGYDVQEVDLFLDEVIRTLEEHEEQRDILLSRIEGLLRELDRCDAIIAESGALAPLAEPAEPLVLPAEPLILPPSAEAAPAALPAEPPAEQAEAGDPPIGQENAEA